MRRCLRRTIARFAVAPHTMPTITVLPHPDYCPQGAVFEAAPGVSLCQAMADGGVELDRACGMNCACTTCHCIVRQGFDSLSEPGEQEEDLLDMAWGLEAQSRLSCQAILGAEDVTVEIPRYSINHAREKH